MAGILKLAWASLCLVFLAGCVAGAQPTVSAGALSEEYDGALPVQTQLIVGTLRLEESEAAVTAEQATRLIPLWKAVRSLNSSDTAAQAEIKALLDQIQEAMTAEQLQAIAGMQLTRQDMLAAMQELGPQLESAEQEGQAFRFGGGQAAGGQAGGGGPPAGFVIEGGPPEGFQGGGPGGGAGQLFSQDLDPEQLATQQAEGGAGLQGAGRAGLFLIEPLLEMLQDKAGP